MDTVIKPPQWTDYKYINFPGCNNDLIAMTRDYVIVQGFNSAQDRIEKRLSLERGREIYNSLEGIYFGYYRRLWVGCYFFYRFDAERPKWLDDAEALYHYSEMKDWNFQVRQQQSQHGQKSFHVGDGQTFIVE